MEKETVVSTPVMCLKMRKNVRLGNAYSILMNCENTDQLKVPPDMVSQPNMVAYAAINNPGMDV
jgi:hypothetical protein